MDAPRIRYSTMDKVLATKISLRQLYTYPEYNGKWCDLHDIRDVVAEQINCKANDSAFDRDILDMMTYVNWIGFATDEAFREEYSMGPDGLRVIPDIWIEEIHE